MWCLKKNNRFYICNSFQIFPQNFPNKNNRKQGNNRFQNLPIQGAIKNHNTYFCKDFISAIVKLHTYVLYIDWANLLSHFTIKIKLNLIIGSNKYPSGRGGETGEDRTRMTSISKGVGADWGTDASSLSHIFIPTSSSGDPCYLGLQANKCTLKPG